MTRLSPVMLSSLLHLLPMRPWANHITFSNLLSHLLDVDNPPEGGYNAYMTNCMNTLQCIRHSSHSVKENDDSYLNFTVGETGTEMLSNSHGQ